MLRLFKIQKLPPLPPPPHPRPSYRVNNVNNLHHLVNPFPPKNPIKFQTFSLLLLQVSAIKSGKYCAESSAHNIMLPFKHSGNI